MESLLQYAPYVAALWAMLLIGRFLLVWTAILRERVRTPHVQLLDTNAPAAGLEPIFSAAAAQLVPLGFELSHVESVDRLNAPDSPPLITQVYWHSECRTYARVSPPTLPGALPFNVELASYAADGTSVATTDCLAHLRAPLPPMHFLYDHYLGDIGKQWQAHQAALHEKHAGQEWVHLAPPVYVARGVAAFEAWHSYLAQRGWLLPAEDGDGRYSARCAFTWAKRVIAGTNRRNAAYKRPPTSSPAIATAQVAADMAAFERLSKERQRPLGWAVKTALFVGSAAVFGLAFGLTFSWETVPIFFGVLLFHELGHLLGMRLFGYRDTQILFLPLLGAVTVGQEHNATAGQKLVIYFLGPVPGLLLGGLALYVSMVTPNPFLNELGLVAVLINGLNLLPILPFDGGRIVESLFFRRFPLLQFIFLALSTFILGTVGWLLGDPILTVAAFFLLLGLPDHWRWSRAARLVRRTVAHDADPTARLQSVLSIVRQAAYRPSTDSARLQLAKRLVDHCASAPVPLGTTLIGSLVYASLLVPILALPLYLMSGITREEFEPEVLQESVDFTSALNDPRDSPSDSLRHPGVW